MSDAMLCAIPARGGSKRLPRKNLLPLAGRPMISYTIQAARASGLFDQVYVCTDDREIAEVAQELGAQVPMLMPPELNGDLVPSHAPCQRLAEELARHGQRFDSLLLLQPTSPLRTVEDIRQGVERFHAAGADFLLSVTPIDPHYFHWAVVPEKEGGFWRMYFGGEFLRERPLLPPVYRPNGSIKIARLEALRTAGHFLGPKLATIETPEERSVHVATRFELDLCESLLRSRA